MLQGPYRNCYSRVYVFSPACAPGVDSAWVPWRRHVRIHMRVPDDEQTMRSTWEPSMLEQLIERHQKVNAYLKAKQQTKCYTICVLADDFADAGDKAMHSSTNVLTSLFVRGRHPGCACWLPTQKQKVISTNMSTNLCWLLVRRLRNSKELIGILEKLDALHDRKVLMAMYQLATSKTRLLVYKPLIGQGTDVFSNKSTIAWLLTSVHVK